MRALTVIAIGLASGALGALMVTRLGAPASTQAALSTAARSEVQPPRRIVPPGWDPRFLERLDAVEQQVAELGDSKSLGEQDGTADAWRDKPASAREQERLAHYQQELASQEQLLADHSVESLDAAWATPLQRELAAKVQAGSAGAEAVDVDCRSKTCIVRIRYPSPSEALAHTDQLPSVAGCPGITSTPPPPTSAGTYELLAVYHCR